MNKDELKGKAENLKGRMKEAFGALTGDRKKQTEGELERAKGAAGEKIGEVKDAAGRKIDEVKRNLSADDDPDAGEHDE